MALLERVIQARERRITYLRHLIAAQELEADAAHQHSVELRRLAMDAAAELWDLLESLERTAA